MPQMGRWTLCYHFRAEHFRRFFMPRLFACFLPLLLISSLTFSQDLVQLSQHVAGTVPVSSSQIQLSAERSSTPHAIAQPNTSREVPGNTWQLLATLPGVIIHDIAFPTAKIGYAVGEEG